MSATYELPPVPARPSGIVRIWLSGLGLAAGLIMIFGFLVIIASHGLEAFWPDEALSMTVEDDSGHTAVYYAAIERESGRPGDDGSAIEQYQIFTGSKDVYGQSFRYIDRRSIKKVEALPQLIRIEPMHGGDRIVLPLGLTSEDGVDTPADSPHFIPLLQQHIKAGHELRERMERIEKDEIGRINSRLDAANRDLKALDMSYFFPEGGDPIPRPDCLATVSDPVGERQGLQRTIRELTAKYEAATQRLGDLRSSGGAALHYQLGDGVRRSIDTGDIIGFIEPNRLGLVGKASVFVNSMWDFISDNPREANTAGGIFPAIFGTFVMTVLMSLLVTPVGVIAAIYLKEYARQGPLVRIVRICVNNLAGVPSIVFGVFGLGFFVYLVGGGIDQVFFSRKLAVSHAPTFGTSGILWASLTLALMTLPVVIVATEEALSSVPKGLREAALACGASKWQMVQRILLPGALPGILTGVILAMARGAGEVAPLMVTGVVKLAPDLPIDFEAPFVHLERKFMHLGFHIYDLGFQSPDSDAARSMVFATTLLLIVLVIVMNLSAIIIRNRLRQKHKLSSF